VLLPKCPLCFAAYGSAIGALGIGPAAHQRLAGVLLALAVTASVGLVLALSLRRGDTVTPMASAAGAGLLLAGRLALDVPLLTALGAAVLVSAALVNSVRCRRWEAAHTGVPTR
jgi:hypothetical protein